MVFAYGEGVDGVWAECKEVPTKEELERWYLFIQGEIDQADEGRYRDKAYGEGVSFGLQLALACLTTAMKEASK